MKAKILKIDPLKESQTENAFRRVYFLMEDGSWAKTDLVPIYHNYKKWKPIVDLIDKGALLYVEGLTFRKGNEVDADSPVAITMTGFENIQAEKGIYKIEGKESWSFVCNNCGKRRQTAREDRALKGFCVTCKAGIIPIRGQINILGEIAR